MKHGSHSRFRHTRGRPVVRPNSLHAQCTSASRRVLDSSSATRRAVVLSSVTALRTVLVALRARLCRKTWSPSSLTSPRVDRSATSTTWSRAAPPQPGSLTDACGSRLVHVAPQRVLHSSIDPPRAHARHARAAQAQHGVRRGAPRSVRERTRTHSAPAWVSLGSSFRRRGRDALEPRQRRCRRCLREARRLRLRRRCARVLGPGGRIACEAQSSAPSTRSSSLQFELSLAESRSSPASAVSTRSRLPSQYLVCTAVRRLGA